jgi:hypothetical protein
MVSRLNKLIQKIRNNPKDVRFDDACKVAEAIGFIGKGGRGSHNSFSRTGERVGLNFQKREGGKIKPYQAKQLIEMIDKYYEDQEPSEKDNNKREEEEDES